MADAITIKPKFKRLYVIVAFLGVLATALTYSMGDQFDPDFFPYLIYGIIVLTIIILCIIFLRWLALTYSFTDAEVIFMEGILTKNKRTVNFKKIDNTTLKRNIPDLLLDTATIVVDTPGSAAAELTMKWIDCQTAYRLEQMLLDQIGKFKGYHPASSDSGPGPDDKAYESPSYSFDSEKKEAINGGAPKKRKKK